MAVDPIKHVIVLMLENRSFDQMLGCFSPSVDGVDTNCPGENSDADGTRYRQQPVPASSFPFDPAHEWENVMEQISNGNSGFVRNFAKTHDAAKPGADYQGIMNYFANGEAYPLHVLAANFTVSDRWFSSVPGPTWANWFFIHSGTSLGRVKMGAFDSVSNALLSLGYSQKTIYNQLDENGIRWAIYAGDFPQAALCEQIWERFENIHLLTSFYSHVTRNESDFPEYVFIEPRYFPPHQNDDHPPHNVTRAQELLASVYNAIRANDALWLSTLFVVLYDEHGGFYDHVSPPSAVSPDGLNIEGCDFKRLGIRVPAIFVSPWAEKGRVVGRAEGVHFDHTSLLKYLGEKWSLPPLTERVREAQSITPFILSSGSPRSDTPPSIVMPPEPKGRVMHVAQPPTSQAVNLNENQAGLVAFAKYMGKTPPNKAKAHATGAQVMVAQPGSSDPQDAKANFQNWIAQTERDSIP